MTSWFSQAACRGRQPLFFTSASESHQSKTRREHQAAQICAECPVLDECRDYVTELVQVMRGARSQVCGFWAGRSFDSRERSRVA